jgi:cytochrome c-type biogenesis protein CcmH/NrfG
LFNSGIVKWQGKKDAKGAIADWEQLLKTNPGYPERQKVEDLMSKAKEHAKG